MKTFENVFQPDHHEILTGDFYLKSEWNNKYFKNDHPIVLELGCGRGEYTVFIAEQDPSRNYIGIDIKGARIWAGAKYAREKDLKNVAFIRTRIEFIRSLFGKNEIGEIWLTFPDPQVKKRRIKKRLTGSRFLNLYKDFLADGGVIHLKTDNEVLFQYTRDLIQHNGLELSESTNDLYHSEITGNAKAFQTRYEKKFLDQSLNIFYLKFRMNHNIHFKEPEIE